VNTENNGYSNSATAATVTLEQMMDFEKYIVNNMLCLK
jgi:hypothetical protein